MHEVVFSVATVWMTALLVAMVITVIRARSAMVRILAVDTLSLILIALLILYAATNESQYYLDAALILSLLSYVATLVMVRFHSERRVFD